MTKIYFKNKKINLVLYDKNSGNYDFIFKHDVKKLHAKIKLFIENDKENQLTIASSNIPGLFSAFKSFFIYIEAAGGLVFYSDYLLGIKRNGVWDLPKGKAEKGELMPDTAIREVKEECGLSDLNILSYLYSSYHIYYQKKKYILKKTYWYNMISKSKEGLNPQTEEGIEEVVWIKKQNIKNKYKNSYQNIKDVIANADI